MGAFDGLLRETLLDTAVLCLPVLLVSAGIGTAVAVLQAATQVQEQTLSLLPKLVGVGIAVTIAGSFGLHLCAGLFTSAVSQLNALTQQ
ncbi:MAG TPA: flagellar biosynthetic protein FliQ [Candidatus Baltobacteraceae bacterium]|jgi:flagellar biosynthetic protein FliQ|nr:flagellar biosynthetic protein FliQ [Candidatus Baltobacteraceae bacterium]